MKVQNRILSILLAALLLSPALTACSEQEKQPPETSAAGTSADTTDGTSAGTSAAASTAPAETVPVTEAQTEPPEPEPVRETDALPAGLSYSGSDFHICTLQSDAPHASWIAEDANGDRIGQAAAERRKNVAERLNIKFTEEFISDISTIQRDIMLDDASFAMINADSFTAWILCNRGLLLRFDDLKYLDLDKSYWDKNLNGALSIGGKQFFAVDVSSITAFDSTHVLLFNRTAAKKKEIEAPYELVSAGKWTLDKFAELIGQASSDLNGDGAMTEADSYGYLAPASSVLPDLWVASDLLTVGKDAGDLLTYNLPSDEKFASLVARAFALTYDSGDWYQNASRDNADPALSGIFEDNRGLFLDTTLSGAGKLRQTGTDFGILPYPKYDEAQKDYLSRVGSLSLSCVPLTMQDTDLISAVLEAFASESIRKGGVYDACCDSVLEAKSGRDTRSAAMLSLVISHRVFDFCDMIDHGVMDGVFTEMMSSNDRALSDRLDASIINPMNGFKTTANKALKELVNKLNRSVR